MIFVLSIYHCASQFTWDLLRGAGLKVHHMHLSDPDQDRLRDLKARHPTVMPIRHPDAVASSWASRGMGLAELAEQWQRMTCISDVTFLPVDSPCREDQLREIERLFSVKLATHWKPSHSMGLPHVPATFENCANFRARWWAA